MNTCMQQERQRKEKKGKRRQEMGQKKKNKPVDSLRLSPYHENEIPLEVNTVVALANIDTDSSQTDEERKSHNEEVEKVAEPKRTGDQKVAKVTQ